MWFFRILNLLDIIEIRKTKDVRVNKTIEIDDALSCKKLENGTYVFANSSLEAMDKSIKETERRRNIQNEYNLLHNITPKTIIKSIKAVISNEVEEKIRANFSEAFEKSLGEENSEEDDDE